MRTRSIMAASGGHGGTTRDTHARRGGRGPLRAATAAGAVALVLAGTAGTPATASASASASASGAGTAGAGTGTAGAGAGTAEAGTTAIASASGATGTPAAVSAARAAGAAMEVSTYQAAAEIADNLNSMSWPGQASYNIYLTGGQSTSVVWGTPGSPTTYFNRSKCGSFVTKVIKRVLPGATDQYLTGNFGSISPTAAQYHDTFTTGAEYFTTSADSGLDQLTEIGAGVIIAIKYNSASPGTGDSTGHVMIVAGAPVRYDRDGNASTVEWAVPVVDTTSNPHGVAVTSASSPYQNFRDSRADGADENPGVGRGWIFIRTDAANRPQGHWWGVNENVTTGYHGVADRPISFGWIGY
ncbi:hypothetical protein [Streptosporangium sp. NPDC002524]|uniref:hypothetical protein n=1 Tax=Streptosporangium sp. NPDC002524 TaxID=3154537 RepID=UPI003322E9B5